MGLPCVICSPSSNPYPAATNGAHLIHPPPVPLPVCCITPLTRRRDHQWCPFDPPSYDPAWRGGAHDRGRDVGGCCHVGCMGGGTWHVGRASGPPPSWTPCVAR